jgi:hypothetical protein
MKMSYEQDDYIAIEKSTLDKLKLAVSGNTNFNDYEDMGMENPLIKGKEYYIIKIVEIQKG